MPSVSLFPPFLCCSSGVPRIVAGPTTGPGQRTEGAFHLCALLRCCAPGLAPPSCLPFQPAHSKLAMTRFPFLFLFGEELQGPATSIIRRKSLSCPASPSQLAHGELVTTENWLPQGPLRIGVTSGASTPDKAGGSD
jgi:hypothetical protein